MTTSFLAPDPVQGTFFIPGTNTPGSGAQVFFYVAGSVSTKQTAYKDNAAATAWTNPIVLDSGGNLPAGAEVWFPTGLAFKVVWAPSTDSDPPISPYRTMDNLSGMNDVSSTVSEWTSGPVPTFVSTTSFTLVGDQTGTFVVGRRVKTTNTGGTIYSTISASVFGVLTTVTVVNDSGVLDAGLSAVSYGLLSATNESVPLLPGGRSLFMDSTDQTKTAGLALAQIPTSSNVTMTLPGYSTNLGLPPDYITGLNVANSASSTAFDVSAGFAMDSTNLVPIDFFVLNNKTQAAFAAGASSGAKMTAAAMSSNAWYACYLLGGSSGAADFGFDTVFPPTVPTTTAAFPQFRYIGARKTTASTTAWAQFTQRQDEVYWNTPPALDVNAPISTASRGVYTVNSPPQRVKWLGGAVIQAVTGQRNALLITDLSLADIAPSDTASPLGDLIVSEPLGTTSAIGAGVFCWTNTSSQIGARQISGNSVAVQTYGWMDPRGRPV